MPLAQPEDILSDFRPRCRHSTSGVAVHATNAADTPQAQRIGYERRWIRLRPHRRWQRGSGRGAGRAVGCALAHARGRRLCWEPSPDALLARSRA